MMIDKAGWHGVKNRSRAHAEIAHDQGVGRGRFQTIAHGLAPRILEFLGSRSSKPPAQNAAECGEGSSPQRSRRRRCGRGHKASHWTSETRATSQIADQPMQASMRTSSSFALPFVCRGIVGFPSGRIIARKRFENTFSRTSKDA